MTADAHEAPKRRMSARAEKAVRFTTAGLVSAPFGFTGYFTGNETLGYIAFGIVVAAILAGPVIERVRGVSY